MLIRRRALIRSIIKFDVTNLLKHGSEMCLVPDACLRDMKAWFGDMFDCLVPTMAYKLNLLVNWM